MNIRKQVDKPHDSFDFMNTSFEDFRFDKKFELVMNISHFDEDNLSLNSYILKAAVTYIS